MRRLCENIIVKVEMEVEAEAEAQAARRLLSFARQRQGSVSL